jgi:two-component system sensor histidine kinase UhpB
LSSLRNRLRRASSRADVDETLVRLDQRIAALADGLRSLSHELHSGVLEHAGLVAALKQHCHEFARHHGLDVSVSADDANGSLDPDVALCLYRVAQEALSNTARHARARAAHVRLALTPGSAELDIADDGQGFDPDRRDGSGLGLRSIGERVRLAKGSVTIESQPGQGTKVRVRIPITDARRVDSATAH